MAVTPTFRQPVLLQEVEMTLVHGRPPVQPARPDDSAALRRRLLQDLERQWLETWGQAGQDQTQNRPGLEPGGARQVISPASRAEGSVHASLASAGANQARWENPADSSVSDDGQAPEIRRGTTSRADRAQARLEHGTRHEVAASHQTLAESAAAVLRGGTGLEQATNPGPPPFIAHDTTAAMPLAAGGTDAGERAALTNVDTAAFSGMPGIVDPAVEGMAPPASLLGRASQLEQSPMPVPALSRNTGLQEPVSLVGQAVPQKRVARKTSKPRHRRNVEQPLCLLNPQALGPGI
jgi:hypothetical protein